MRRQYRRAAAALALACALLRATPLAGQAPAHWDPDDRVLIGPFAYVVAITADAWRVHAATVGGLISYDPVTRRWDLPLTIEDGYPAQERPSALLAARGEQTLVLGTASGTLWRVDPAGRRFERLADVPGAVTRLVAGEFGALYALTPRGWYHLAPGSLFPEQVAGEPPGARHREDARLAALRSRIELDGRMRRSPVTALTPGNRADEYYAGTAGGGVVRVDALTHQVERVPYGLGSEGVGAVAVNGGQVWFGGDGSARGGANVATADVALQRWEWHGANGEDVPRGVVSAIATHRGDVWLAASDGLYRYQPQRGLWDRPGTREGLPGNDVLALHAADSVLWIGTSRGACAWLGSACSATVLPGIEITALTMCRGELWLGTAAGLYRAAPGAPAERAAEPGVASGPVRALACARETLAVAMSSTLFLHDGAQWQPAALARRAALRALAADDQALWVGGDGGVARRDAVTGEWTYYISPGDVPVTPVWGLAPAGPHLWLATPAGAVRLDVRRR